MLMLTLLGVELTMMTMMMLYYPLALIQSLLDDFPDLRVGILYDIGCQLNKHITKAQWESERHHNLTTAIDVNIRQKLELGRLLCLEDRMYRVWDEDTLLELRAFDRLDRFQDLATQIAEQRRKVWFAKTEVRRHFLALRAEQWPLDPENKVGGSSRLGTHKKERIMGAIARRTRTMKKTLNNYNDLARAFAEQNPDQPASPEVEYVNLISMEPDDPFWSNGLVQDLNQPTQLLQPFLSNKSLDSLSIGGKVEVAKGLLHNTFVRISTLTLHWDSKAMSVMMLTPAQIGDLALMTLWKSQVCRINDLRSKDCASIKLGDFENLFGPVNQMQEDPPQNRLLVIEEGGEEEEEEELWHIGIEEEWENRINEGMLINMMANVGLERDIPPPILVY
ncbi:uncharacterized protein MELLADRAFT_61241 [Melampsora larici-populina 98AG31]|uniref:Uncharacterized protein n=1 Tax=Melampsora larici-populina (strain 98AG31 / pathotype 3-4-7) TaxID=747676 RepID=F4RE55_MELLP|nr:uncharacterized protein MELLADRAFT_61241 [Melampsora larici-populina 98AG31]EGG09032.1 hypothetical protein MELLADRAFT_61241 [Melampsora larici-populina 98AG31]